ncbi:MAG: hypothetical protein FJ397_08715 [Verrucomicrobia bacterium]|nr:hypothetical protein [Verrucomicrobiota bacterium]
MRLTRRARLSAVCLLALAGTARAGEPAPSGLPRQSPFAPPGTPASESGAAPAENLEFAGVSSVGKRTDLIFHDREAKRTLWIGVGESKAGIQVVAYDGRREQAILKVNGADKVLPLRKGSRPKGTPVATPAPVTAPDAPPPGVVFAQPFPGLGQPEAIGDSPTTLKPVPPAAPQRQEAEARMLVSDLLEIGMAQRRAYEETQRRQAQANPPPAPAPDGPP